MSLCDLEKLLECAYDVAKKMVADQSHEMLTPVFLAITPCEVGAKKDLQIIGAPMGDDRKKDMLAQLLRRKFKQDRTEAYLHVGEAWALNYDGPMSPLNDKNFIPPSKSERRKEIVIFAGQTREGDSLMAMADIMRDANNIRSLGPLQDRNYEKIGGRFATLLSE